MKIFTGAQIKELDKYTVEHEPIKSEAEQVATKVADSFEEAYDLALEAVQRQLEKNKEKK